MIPVSNSFTESLADDVQIVKPNVKAWMADYRYLENLTVHTSSHTYSKQILDRSPQVYIKLDKTNYNSIFREADVAISVANPAFISYANNNLSAGTPVIFATTNFLPTGMTAGVTYYVQAPTSLGFNINITQQNAIDNISTGQVITTAPGSGTHSVSYYFSRVQDSGIQALEVAYGKSVAAAPSIDTALGFQTYGLFNADGSNKNIEIPQPKRLVDTFNKVPYTPDGYSFGLGPFTYNNSSVTASDMSSYSWRYSEGTKWQIDTGKAVWFDNSTLYHNIPVYIYVNSMSIDHSVDFVVADYGTAKGGVGAIVRFVDDDNYIYCRQRASSDASAGTMAIYKVIDGVHTLVKSIESVRFASTNYYRFEAKYNTFTLYNMGEFEPDNNTVGTVLSNAGVDLTCYIDDEIFRTPSATYVGLLNAGVKTYNTTYTTGSATFAFDFFGVYGFNYLSGAHYFDGTKYILSSSSIDQNSKVQFNAINNVDNFTYSFIFKKMSGGESTQTICWLGDSSNNTALKVEYITATNKIKVRVVENSTNTVYTINSSFTFSLNFLYYIQVVKNNNNLELYVNGNLDTTLSLPSSFILKDITTTNTPYLIIGADYAKTTLGDSDSYHLFNGHISEFAIFDYNINSFDSISIFNSIDNNSTLVSETSDKYFSADNAVDGVMEETFLYAFTDMLNKHGNVIKSNNHSYTTLLTIEDEKSFNVENNYGWMSRSQSDSGGVFAKPDHLILEFDAQNCNRIFVSTGYMNGRINEFSYIIYRSDGRTISGLKNFNGESFVYIDPEDLGLFDQGYISIVAVKILPTSTVNPYDYARIFSINPIWEVDLSDRVMSFGVDKVRDNYDASLPIGATAANNGSLDLDNTDLVFNPYGNSLYGSYINPDTRFFISLDHELRNSGTQETIPVAHEMYADTWSIDTSSMTVSVDLRDYSKFLQEGTIKGYISQNLCAGRSVHDLMLSSGFPNRRIFFNDKYKEQVSFDDPTIHLLFSRKINPDVYIDDECLYIRGVDSSVGTYKSSIIYSDILNVQNDSARVVDELAPTVYTPVYKSGSYKPGGEITLQNLSTGAYWTPANYSYFTFGIIAYVNDASTLASGTYYNLMTYKTNADASGMFLQYQKSSSDSTKIIFKFYFNDISAGLNVIESQPLDISKPHIIYISKENITNTYTLYVDGYAEGSMSVSTAPNVGLSPRVKISATGDTYISNFTYYNYALSSSRILEHHISAQLSIIPTFKYLFASDGTYWDAMLNIATADLGMFYFDEYGDFRYEYRNLLNETVYDRYQNSQYSFSDEENIISGSLVSEVQTNKVNVKTNSAQISSSSLQNLWTAEDGESLAVTSLLSDVYPKSTSIELTNTSNPIFLPSGYIKINEEIIKYNSLVNNTISGLERGAFNTKIGWHSAGDRVREARYYRVEYSSSPAVSVNFPFITQFIYYDTLTVDRFNISAFNAEVVVSAKDPGPPTVIDGVEYFYQRGENYSNIVFLQGKDPLVDVDNNFAISGIPLSQGQSTQSVTEYSAQIIDNIRKYRLKEIDIDNQFIENKIYAQIIADYVIGYFSDPVKIINLNIHGVPHLQLGDLITVEKFEQSGIINQDFWVIQSNVSYDGGIQQSLVLREYSEPIPAPELNFI